MVYPKLTQGQLEKIARAAEKVIVHPFNVCPEKYEGDSHEIMKQSFLEADKQFRELITPQSVLSMVQTITQPNSQKEFDINKELI